MFTRIFGPSRAQQQQQQQVQRWETIQTSKGINLDSSYKQMMAKDILLEDKTNIENYKLLNAFFNELSSTKFETFTNRKIYIKDTTLKNIIELHKTFPMTIGRLATKYIETTSPNSVDQRLAYIVKDYQWSTSMITPTGVHAALSLPGMDGERQRGDIIDKLVSLVRHKDPKIAENAARTLLIIAASDKDTRLQMAAKGQLAVILNTLISDDLNSDDKTRELNNNTRELQKRIRAQASDLIENREMTDVKNFMRDHDPERAQSSDPRKGKSNNGPNSSHGEPTTTRLRKYNQKNTEIRSSRINTTSSPSTQQKNNQSLSQNTPIKNPVKNNTSSNNHKNLLTMQDFDHKKINFISSSPINKNTTSTVPTNQMNPDLHPTSPKKVPKTIVSNNNTSDVSTHTRIDFESIRLRAMSSKCMSFVAKWMEKVGDKYPDITSKPNLCTLLALSEEYHPPAPVQKGLSPTDLAKKLAENEETEKVGKEERYVAELLAGSNDRDKLLKQLMDLVEGVPDGIIVKSARKAIRTLMSLENDDLRHQVRSVVIDIAKNTYPGLPHPDDRVGPVFMEALTKLDKSGKDVPAIFPDISFITTRSIYKLDRKYAKTVKSIRRKRISEQADYFLKLLNSNRDTDRRGAKELLDTLRLNRKKTIKCAINFVKSHANGTDLSAIDPLILLIARLGYEKQNNKRAITYIDQTLGKSEALEVGFRKGWEWSTEYFRVLDVNEVIAIGRNQPNPNTIYKAFGDMQASNLEQDLRLFTKSKKKVMVIGAHRSGHFTTLVCVKDSNNKVNISILNSIGEGTEALDDETARQIGEMIKKDGSPVSSLQYVRAPLQFTIPKNETPDEPYSYMHNSCGLFSLMMNDWINTLGDEDTRLNSSNPNDLVDDFVTKMKSMRQESEYKLGQMNLYYRLRAISNSMDVKRNIFADEYEKNWLVSKTTEEFTREDMSQDDNVFA